jgi:iron(III) transport system substrate-binding protein
MGCVMRVRLNGWMGLLTTSFALAAAALSSCKRDAREVVAYTSVDQVFAEPVFRAFEKQTGIAVRAVYDTEETKSTGVVNRLIAEANSPRADVFWCNDPVRPLLLIRRGMVTPYLSPNAAAIPSAFKAGDGTWTDFSARVRVLLVNKNRVPSADTPRSMQAFLDPRWKGQVAIANPVFGTTTMHVAALFATWGDERARAFMDSLKKNDVRVASSNGEVKRLVASGEIAFGVADNDDASEALKEGAPVEVVYPDQDGMGTLLIPTSEVLIRGGPHTVNGKRLIDFLLSAEVEKELAERASHLPLRPGVTVPANVPAAGSIKLMPIDYGKLGETMERIQPWLREWAGL